MFSKNDSFLAKLDQNTTLFWFRRDLRLTDNAGLYRALKSDQNILAIFIFDTVILDELEDKQDRRVEFILESLQMLKASLEAVDSSLLVLHGDPVKIFSKIKSKAVFTNHDYEPYAIGRDEKVKAILEKNGTEFHSFKDQVIFEKSEVVKDNGEPYTVFTPYSRKWKAKLNKFYEKSYPTEKYFSAFYKTEPLPFPTLSEIGFERTKTNFPERSVKGNIIKDYHLNRNFPGMVGTSRLGVHLRFGTVSIRKLVQLAQKRNETWLNELIWREFYQMILWHFPKVDQAFKPQYDRIRWRNNVDEFEAWCEGRTGYPLVDAGMRELNSTGFMHNRVRMVAASFLTKHLLIDWRWGEAYFAKKLLDFDLASNNGGWQWAASSGCDAAPYFRVFNPELQMQKFDPEFKYIRQWVPEFETKDYPKPLVDHKKARERVLKIYKAALEP